MVTTSLASFPGWEYRRVLPLKKSMVLLTIPTRQRWRGHTLFRPLGFWEGGDVVIIRKLYLVLA